MVEDTPEVLDALTVLLRLEGAEVVGAATGDDALAAWRARDFDLLLSDLGLPDIPGDVLIRALITREEDRIPVVVITGQSEPHLTRARQAGADVVLTKPVDWAKLLDYLNAVGRRPAA